MKKGTNKRGLVAPQPAAALAALDFAHASEAFRRALSLPTGPTEADTDAAAEVVAQCADRLLGIPTTRPAHIAEKVAAYAWLANVSPNLSDPATQYRIAEGQDDTAKGLLAIYLDLMKLADTQPAEAQPEREPSDEDELRVTAERFDTHDMPQWGKDSYSHIPTNEEAGADTRGHLMAMRLAYATVTKTKPELLALVRELDNDGDPSPENDDNNLSAALRLIGDAGTQFGEYQELLDTAYARLLTAMSKVQYEACQ
jgi:hypothetical protein